ncbi:MAG: anti-anti-sigma factor [Gammaproteobacteria bacterium]|nr:MAG: anti-anti-sigma factor [Gammaproteobacteria bacterium]
MSITTNSGSDGQLVIKILGRFDFSVHQDFKNAYESSESKNNKFEVNLSGTSYLDSSALGMLLLLRDYAGGDSSSISITNASADIKKILTISNFQQLFKID